MKKLVMGFALMAYLLLSTVVHAHCGKMHDEGAVAVAQLLLPKEEALARDIAIREIRCQEASQKLDEMILELISTSQVEMDDEVNASELGGNGEVMQSKDFRVENGRFNSIAPGQLKIDK